METTFLHRFTNRGVTDNIAAFVRVENGVICEEFRNGGSNEGPLDQRGPKPRPDKCGDGASTRTHKTMEREREHLTVDQA